MFFKIKKIQCSPRMFLLWSSKAFFIWLLCIVLEFWEHISQYRVLLFTLCTIHESLTPPPIPSGPYRQGSKYSCVRLYFSSTFQENWNFLYSIPILSVQRASNFWRNHVISDADFFLNVWTYFLLCSVLLQRTAVYITQGWGDGSMMKGTCCSWRPSFSSQATHLAAHNCL